MSTLPIALMQQIANERDRLAAALAEAERERDEATRVDSELHKESAALLRELQAALAAAERREAQLTEALKWFASGDAWVVTRGSIADHRYGFFAPDESVYSTPWGFARAALRAAADEPEPERDGA